ncbi:MAG: extracellular solute-binding protein [Devosia sp.]|uniref:extracellular solute-binding protein n=1 Tax=Devosia sp. TaxID=1871048 RepID=UPI001A4D6442|nr:extracellular solute-binding protein [Devosia sp.]MBL8596954.1 extracellular solute-binding protein [Devosia sp.]
MHKTKILLAGLSLLALTSAASAVDVRISGWGGAEVALVNGLITDVLAEDLKATDINVVYEPVDGDFSQFITNALSAGTAPDLFYTDIFWSRAAFGTGKVEPTTADTSPFAPNLIDAFTYDGKVMALPKDFNTLALQYNKDIFDDAGVAYPTDDETWATLQDKLVAIHAKLPDVNGLCVVPDYARFAAFALGSGWEPFNAEGKTVLDDNFKRAFAWYTGLVPAGAAVAAADVGEGWTGGCFTKELTAVAVEGAWIIGGIRDGAPNLNWGTARIPKDPESGQAGNLIFTVGWTVNADSAVKDAAQKVAELLTSEKAQQWVLEQGLALPSRSALVDNPWLQGDTPEQTVNRVVFAGLSDGNVEPFFFGDLGGAWMEPINTALNSVLTGEADVDTALAAAQAKFDGMAAQKQ